MEIQKLIVYEREFTGELMEFFDVTDHHEYKIEEAFVGSYDMNDAVEEKFISTDFIISYKYRSKNYSINGTFPIWIKYEVNSDKAIKSIQFSTNSDYDDEFRKIISAATDYYKIEEFVIGNLYAKKVLKISMNT